MGLLSGIGGLIGALGPSGTKTDRGIELQGLGDLGKLFNFGFGQGQQQQGEGQGTMSSALSQLGPAAQYFRNLLTGGRQASLSAAQPTVNAANAQADAQKQDINLGTARGGGVNSAAQQIETNKNSNVDNAIAQARTGAAGGATQVAGATAGIGRSQLDNAMALLGLGSNSATSMASIADRSRNTSQDIHNQTASQIGASIADLMKTFGNSFGNGKG